MIIAESGAAMSRFPTAAHLASWTGLVPAMNESAGKRARAQVAVAYSISLAAYHIAAA